MFAGIGNKRYKMKCYLFWYFKSDINRSLAGETRNMFETEKEMCKIWIPNYKAHNTYLYSEFAWTFKSLNCRNG